MCDLQLQRGDDARCASSKPQDVCNEVPVMKRALIVVTSHAVLGSTGKATGYYLPEVSHPYVALREAGFAVDFASPRGGEAPMDPASRNLDDADNRALL